MGIEMEVKENKSDNNENKMNALYASILKYPAMLNDVHVKKQ